VSASELEPRPGGGRSNGVRPSLSSASISLWCCRSTASVPSAGVGAPRKLHGPAHVRQILPASDRGLETTPPLPADALTWNYVKVLTCTYFSLPDAVSTSTAVAERAANFRALLDARLDPSASSTDLCCQREEHYPAGERMSSSWGLDFLGGRPDRRRAGPTSTGPHITFAHRVTGARPPFRNRGIHTENCYHGRRRPLEKNTC
jgi:hypothetical protein